jgi:hypothetical protein
MKKTKKTKTMRETRKNKRPEKPKKRPQSLCVVVVGLSCLNNSIRRRLVRYFYQRRIDRTQHQLLLLS